MSQTAFSHRFPPMRVECGADCLTGLARALSREGVSRPLICCGPTLARDPDGLRRLIGFLGGMHCTVFDGVTQHSTVPGVTRAVGLAREAAVDGILAFGGGSAVVTARAVAIGLAEDAPFHALATRTEGGRIVSPRLARPKVPIFVVQTTPNTASVKVGTAVMDPDTRRRLPMFDPATRTRVLFLDPAFLNATPQDVIRIAALQTLSQTVEGLASETPDPFARAALRHAMDLLLQALPQTDSPDRAMILAQAAVLTGEATDHTGGGALAAALSHTIASLLDLPTGAVVAPILPHTIRFNAEAGGQVLQRAFGSEPSAACRNVIAAAGGPLRLRDAGVPQDSLPAIAKAAMSDYFLSRNPVPVTDSGVLLDLLRASY